MGWDVSVFRPEDNYVESAKKADAVLLDLRWSSHGRKLTPVHRPLPTSKVAAQVLTQDQPYKPMLFVSNFFVGTEYGNIEQEISPVALTDRVEKRSRTTLHVPPKSSEQSDIVEEIHQKLSRLIEQSESLEEKASEAPTGASEDPEALRQVFAVSPYRYHSMNSAERLALTRRASAIVEHIVDFEFENSYADWLLVGGLPPRVIRWGQNADTLTDSEIAAIATEYDFVPFFYSRPEYIS
jgi:hypothetical protein